MLFGSFDIRIDTPKTFKRGTVSFTGSKGELEATVKAGKLENVVLQGTYDDKDFSFDIDIDVPDLGEVKGRFTGTVWGNSIDGTGQMNIGKVEVRGTSISAATGDADGKPGSMYAGRWSDGF